MERSSARLAWMLLVLCALIRPAMAQESRVLQTNASSGNGTVLTVTGLSAVGLSVAGAAAGADRVVNFEASQNTTGFVAIMCTNAQTLAQATTATVSGTTLQLWRCPVSGFTRFRARVSAGTTGGANVTVTGTTVASGGSGGSGGMNLTETDGSPTGVAWQLKVTPGSLTMNPDGTATVLMGGVGGGDVFGPAASVAGQLAIFDDNTGKVLDVATLQGTLPITVTPGVGTITLAATDAGADGATKGVATFATNDFNAAAGVVSLDYSGGQKATAGQDGFLDNADFATFAAKANNSLTISTTAPLGGGGDLTGNRTFTCTTCTTNAAALTANAPMIGAGGQAAAVGTRSGDTTEFATVSGAKTQNKQLAFDATGNVVASATDIGQGSGHTIADEGTPLAQQRTVLNFAGAGVTCADDTDKTTCTIPGGAGLADPGGNGLVVRTGLGVTTARTLTGTSNEIEVSNGDGVVGAPTAGIPDNAQLHIAKITSLLTNGPVVTTGGDGTLSVSTQVLTQSGLTWNVNAATCTTDPNGGTLTISGTEIVCAGDDGGGGGTAFSSITTATNTNQTLTVGTSSVLTTADTGTIVANRVAAGGAGIVEVDGSNVPSPAEAADVVAIFGGGTCAGYLKSDGSCDTGSIAMQEIDLAPNGQITTLEVSNGALAIVGSTATLSVQTPLTASVDYATPGDLTTGLAGKEDTLGFVPANSGTTLDIDGTANEIEVSVDPPQDLSTNRAWTIGIPANAQLSVAKLLNLTTNGWVKTSAGDGTLGVQDTLTAADVGLGNVTNAAQLTRGAGDFSAGGIAEKAAPIGADRLLIEDSAAGNAKKYVQITNLPGTAGSKHVIKDEGGAGLTPRTNLNCVGAGITCSDDAGNDATVITVVGGGGGGGAPFAVDFVNATQIVIPATGATGHNLGTDVLVAIYDTTGKQILCETNTPAGVITINCSLAQSGRVVVTGGPSNALLATQRLFLHAAYGGL